MKNTLKKLLSLFLVLTMTIGIAPLSGFVGLELPEWFSLKTNAETTDPLTYEVYKSKMMLGLEDVPESIDKANEANVIFNYYFGEDVYSPSGNFLEDCYNNKTLMAEVNAWKAYSLLGAPSDAVDMVMNHEDYCMALILQTLEMTLTSEEVLDHLKYKAVKNSNDIIKELCSGLEVSEEFKLLNAYRNEWGVKWGDLSTEEIGFWSEVVEKSSLWSKSAKVTGYVGDILSYSADIFEAADKIAMYGAMSELDYFTCSWLKEMYDNCPDSDVAMKAALLKLYNSSTSLEGEWLTSVIECEETLLNWTAKAMIDNGVSTLCSLHPAVATIFLGFAAGKTVCNILFESDAVCEQFSILEWLLKLQDLAADVVETAKEDFTKDQSIGNANLFITYTDLFFKSIIDVDIDCMIKFMDLVYNRGALFPNRTEEYNDHVKTLESTRKMRWNNYNTMNDFVDMCYEAEYPEDYSDVFGDITDKIRVPVKEISSYLSILPPDYPEGADLVVGDYRTIYVNYSPSNTTQKDVEITSDNEAVAEVIIEDDIYKVKGNSEGVANITIQSMYNNEVKHTFKIVVAEKENDEDDENSIGGSCGANLTWSLNTVTGKLKIEGTGAMYNYSSPYKSAPWYSNRSSIKTVNISYGVTNIGKYAFYNCDSLTSIIIPDSVTSIGDRAFLGCTSLKEITMPVSAKIYNSSQTFQNCINIEKATLTKGTGVMQEYGTSTSTSSSSTHYQYTPWYISGNTVREIIIEDGVTNISDRVFLNCTSLTSITIPDSVTSIGDSAFCNCTSLISAIIGDSVTIIDDRAFANCTSLTSVTIGDSVTRIYAEAFYNCDSLTSIIIPDSVTSIGDRAFYDCDSLTSITIPDSVTSIGDSAFKLCESLVSVIIPDSVTRIYAEVFYDCDSLTSVTIGDSVTSIGDSAFYDCDSLTSVTIGDSVTRVGNSAFAYCYSLTSVTIPDSVTIIGGYAFGYCTSLTSVVISDSVTSIGEYTFFGCTGLKELTLPASGKIYSSPYTFGGCVNIEKVTFTKGTGVMQNYDSSSYEYTPWYISRKTIKEIVIEDGVTNISDWAFYKCTSLTSVTIGDSVTSVGKYAFEYCTSLISVNVPDTVTSIGYHAFHKCTSLTSVTIGDSVTSVDGYAFEDCTSLIDVYYTGDIGSWCNISFSWNESNPMYYAKNFYIDNTLVKEIVIPDTVAEIKDYAFCGFKGISSVTIPDSVTSIGDSAFSGCTSITSIAIPDSVISIGDSVFSDCTSITSIAIPDSVTSIGDDAFYCCLSLTRITISDSITEIGDFAFYPCNSLTDVYYNGTQEDWNEITIGSYNEKLTGATIHFLGDHTHEYTEELTKEATCSSTGTKTMTCSCGFKYTEVIQKLPHTEGEWTVTKAPICSEKGVEESKCTVCGLVASIRDIPKLPHTPGMAVKENEKEVTCTTGGSYDTVVYCTVCKEELSRETTVIPAEGHTDSKAVEENKVDATCMKEGSYDSVVYCTKCNTELSREEKSIPLANHKWSAWEVTAEPTMTEKGEKVRTCSVCKETDEAEIPATGITVTVTDSDGKVVEEKIIEGDLTEISFDNIADGEYTVSVSQATYTSRNYLVSSTNGKLSLGFKLSKKGDVTGDDKLNTIDVARANSHAKGVSTLTDYSLACADVNGDGKVNTIDVARINSHAKGVSTLW